jgi:hypothetical protein
LDETYQTHLNRVAKLILSPAHQAQFQHIQESPKFSPHPQGGRKAAPFPGYSVITPPRADDAENEAFYQSVQACQTQVVEAMPAGLLVPVPPESFHFTLADLIWDGAYRDASQNPEFEGQLHKGIARSFRHYGEMMGDRPPIRWQLLGLMARARAIAACLVPKDEPSYNRVVGLRRAIYQNPQLIPLGIEQQYVLTAHITLGYFGDIPEDLDRTAVANTLSQLSARWMETDGDLHVRRAELRKFDDMTRYYRQPDWPALEF